VVVTYVLDTNIIIYFLKGLLLDLLPDGEFLVSVISEIEVLSYHSLPADDEALIRKLLGTVTLADLSPEVRLEAIRMGRAHRLKTPDSIIAATAAVHDAVLLTNDAALLRLSDVRSQSLAMRDV
jgi:predicted nucleic acid-binding protein